jgi:hypothetical protein
MIYDPATRRTSGGVTDPFPNNVIQPARLDKVALKCRISFESRLPACWSTISRRILAGARHSGSSVKIDQVVNAKNKFALLMNRTSTKCDFCAGADGFPLPVSAAISTYPRAHGRLNWDTTLSPTMLVHWGIGFTQNWLGAPRWGISRCYGGLGLKARLPDAKPRFPFHWFEQHAIRRQRIISSTGALADDVSSKALRF